MYSAHALERLALGLSTVAAPDQLRDLIAEALSDPSVELYFRQPDGGWWDSASRGTALPLEDAVRCVSPIPDDGDPVAAIAYDAALRDQRRLVGAVGASALAALARLRLTVALNSAKHAANASEAAIRLTGDGRLLHFRVIDDGTGFINHQAVNGAGLTNMRDRVGAVGGRDWIDSAPGRGTVVHGQIPIAGTGMRPA